MLISRRDASDTLSVLDIGCGTGRQLVANRSAVPQIHLVGLDRSLGMLRQAKPKAADIAWVQADAAMLPFRDDSFDYVSCQFAFHHVENEIGMLHAAFDALRPGGRLVLHNLCPQECPDWLYYKYFPEVWAIDLADFWSPQAIVAAMETAGFVEVAAERRHIYFEQNLRDWLSVIRRRDTCSQLIAITDSAYSAGLLRLERELADNGAATVRANHLCLVTIRAEKRSGRP